MNGLETQVIVWVLLAKAIGSHEYVEWPHLMGNEVFVSEAACNRHIKDYSELTHPRLNYDGSRKEHSDEGAIRREERVLMEFEEGNLTYIVTCQPVAVKQ